MGLVPVVGVTPLRRHGS